MLIFLLFIYICFVSKLLGNNVFSRNYIYVNEPKNHPAANQYCIDHYNSRLASIHSQTDIDEIQSIKGAVTAWIGLYVKPNTYQLRSQYENADGSPWDYATDVTGGIHPWSAGEPNHLGFQLSDAGQSCVQMYSNGLLDDDFCLVNRPFICNNPGFKYFNINKNQHDANDECKQPSNGGRGLASITSAQENNIIANIVPNNVNAYFGLQRVNNISPWHWEDQTPFNSGNYGYCGPNQVNCGDPWSAGEPNNFAGGQHCSQFYGASNKWDDVHCHILLPFICILFDRNSQYQFNGNIFAYKPIVIEPNQPIKKVPDNDFYDDDYFDNNNNKYFNNDYSIYSIIGFLVIYPIFIGFLIIMVYRFTCYLQKDNSVHQKITDF